MAESTVLDRLIKVLETGKGADGCQKDVVCIPNEEDFSFDRLGRKDAARLLRALRKTSVLIISVHLSPSCEDKVPKSFRKHFKMRGECRSGYMRKGGGKKENVITYFSPVFFAHHYIREGKAEAYIEVITGTERSET